MVSSMFLPGNSMGWEVYPSSRQAAHPWSKYVPINKTLSTTNTAEDLYTANAETPTVNLVTNPSFETGAPPTGFTAAGSTPTRVNTVARSGTYSLQINPANSDAGEGVYWETPEVIGKVDNNNPVYLVVSAYFQDNTNSSATARIEIRDSAGTTTHTTGNTITLTNSWQRSTAVYHLPNTATTYRIYLVSAAQHNTNFFVDDMQVEIRQDSNATGYCDGAQGVDYEWYGTAHASESRRKSPLAIIRGMYLHFSHATYLSFNTDASASTGIYINASAVFEPSWPIDIRDNVWPPSATAPRISFVNCTGSETPTVRGVIWGIPQSSKE